MFKSCIAYFAQTIIQINSITSIIIVIVVVVHLCILHLGENRQFNTLVQVPTCLGAHSLMWDATESVILFHFAHMGHVENKAIGYCSLFHLVNHRASGIAALWKSPIYKLTARHARDALWACRFAIFSM